MSNIYMGIDQSLVGSGITVFSEGEEYYYLISSSKTKNTKTPTIDYTKRLIKIVEDITEIIKKYKPDYICMEGMSYASRGNTLFELGGLSHMLRALYFTKDIKFIIIPPKTLKKYYTGSGNADKLAMIEEANKRGANIPFFKRIKKQTVFDDNVVDSHALCCFVEDYLQGNCKDYEDKIEKSWEL